MNSLFNSFRVFSFLHSVLTGFHFLKYSSLLNCAEAFRKINFNYDSENKVWLVTDIVRHSKTSFTPFYKYTLDSNEIWGQVSRNKIH